MNSKVKSLIRKCLICLVINKAEGYERIDLLKQIEVMLKESLDLLESK